MNKEKKRFYQKWWFWVIIILIIIGSKSNNKNSNENNTNSSQTTIETSTTFSEETTTATTEEPEIKASSFKDKLSKLEGKSVKEGMPELNKTGCQIQYLNQGEDFTEFIDSMNDNIITDFDFDDNSNTIIVNILGKDVYQAKQMEEKGKWWFQNINWEKAFPYKSDIHYIIGYSFQETEKEFKKYGKYVAMSSADLSNAFGTKFKSTVYIFMDKKGNAKHIFYDEADGSSYEIDMDNIVMKNY